MTRLLAVLLIALTASPVAAQPAFLAQAYCRLWPRECRPAAPAPVQPPAPKAAPAPAAAPAQAPPVPQMGDKWRTERPGKRVKTKALLPKAKPGKLTAPRRKAVALPSWCALVPAGTSMEQIEAEAPRWGVTMTAENRRQARACLASK